MLVLAIGRRGRLDISPSVSMTLSLTIPSDFFFVSQPRSSLSYFQAIVGEPAEALEEIKLYTMKVRCVYALPALKRLGSLRNVAINEQCFEASRLGRVHIPTPPATSVRCPTAWSRSRITRHLTGRILPKVSKARGCTFADPELTAEGGSVLSGSISSDLVRSCPGAVFIPPQSHEASVLCQHERACEFFHRQISCTSRYAAPMLEGWLVFTTFSSIHYD